MRTWCDLRLSGVGSDGRMNGFRREKTAVPRRINYT